MNKDINNESNKLLEDKITILGSGAFGTAIAHTLSRRNKNIQIFGIDFNEINDINKRNCNSKYFPQILSKNISATSDIKEAIKDAKILLIATPSNVASKLFKDVILPVLEQPVYIINLSKGLDFFEAKSITSIVEEIVPTALNKGILKLSGPSFAIELMKNNYTKFVLSSKEKNNYDELKKYFNVKNIKLEYRSDIEAVEIVSVLKNAYAIMLGIHKGLGYGKNSEAFLFSEIIDEMREVFTRSGLDQSVINSAAGLWDLYLTGTTRTSRNFDFGYIVGEGENAKREHLESMKTIEGVKTISFMTTWMKKNNVKLNIIQTLHEIIYEGKNPRNALIEYFEKII